MYQDELYREAKVFVQGWQYILEDTAKFFSRLAAVFSRKH